MTDSFSWETSKSEAKLDRPDEPGNKLPDEPQSAQRPGSPVFSAKPKRKKKVRDLYYDLPVLRTESKAHFIRLRSEIWQDLEPHNSIEKIYFEDFVHRTWDEMRYRRITTQIFNNALGLALKCILRRIQFPPSRLSFLAIPLDIILAPENTAYEWLFNPETRRRVRAMLEEAGFDESAIEAEAYRLVADDLERANRQLNAAVAGRDKALRSIAKYRSRRIADQLRQNADRVIAADKIRDVAKDGEEWA